MNIEKILGEKFTFRYKDADRFKKFKVRSMTFTVDKFSLNDDLANLTIWRGVGFRGLTKIRSVFITPKTKDMPVICYAKIKMFFFDIFVIEIYDTCLNKRSFPTLQAVNDKYKEVPTYKPQLSNSKKWLLKESIYKKTRKKSFVLSVEAFEEHLHEYGRLLLESPNCSKKDKMEITKQYITEGLLLENSPFKDMYLRNNSVDDLNELYKKALFDTEN